ncbi:MAG TPA: hypothetical protein VM204_06535 [Gaiellaceae bacterium]|nr:hypothetical protein [Gaiellaceae bacterium]
MPGRNVRLLTLLVAVAAGSWACGTLLDSADEPAAPTASPDAGARDVVLEAAETTPGDPDPDEPQDELDGPPPPDAGCGGDASFEEDFVDSFGSSFEVVIADGGSLHQDLGNRLVAAGADNRDGARAYIRRSMCNAGPALVCTVRVRAETLTDGDVAFFELRGKDAAGKDVVVRAKTNEAQLDAEDALRRSPLALGPLDQYRTITVTTRAAGAMVSTDGIEASFDAGLDGVRFAELRAGVVYLARSNRSTAAALLQIDALSCSVGP